jgi:hypothetical protein
MVFSAAGSKYTLWMIHWHFSLYAISVSFIVVSLRFLPVRTAVLHAQYTENLSTVHRKWLIGVELLAWVCTLFKQGSAYSGWLSARLAFNGENQHGLFIRWTFGNCVYTRTMASYILCALCGLIIATIVKLNGVNGQSKSYCFLNFYGCAKNVIVRSKLTCLCKGK